MRDSLHAVVGTVRAAPVGPWQHVTGWRAQALSPKDRGRIEDEVVLRAGVDRGSPMLRLDPAAQGRAFGHDLKSWNPMNRNVSTTFCVTKKSFFHLSQRLAHSSAPFFWSSVSTGSQVIGHRLARYGS